MNPTAQAGEPRNIKDIIRFVLSELRPKGKIITIFNLISAPVILIGGALVVYRLAMGLGAVTDSSQEFPWGIWIGLVVMVGVAFAGGAYILTFVVYILNSAKYHTIIRLTVLNGFLAYVFYASAIFLDIGRWWNILNPVIGNRFGVNSVLFLVAWHFMLYMMAAALEFSPAAAEWLGLRRMRRILGALTVGAVIFGITLSTLHQSGLGALLMMAKGKIHPLWYTEFIPILFFVSSIYAGLAMVIFVGWMCSRVFKSILSAEFVRSLPGIEVGLAKGCAVALFAFFFLKILILVHGQHWSLLGTPMGAWFIVELLALVGLPCFLFLYAARIQSSTLIRATAVWTLLGIIVNRLNYVMIAFKWYIPMSERHFPSLAEIVVTCTIVFAHIWVLRWIIHRMPILRKSPEWAMEYDSH